MHNYFNDEMLDAAKIYLNQIVGFGGESGQFILSQHLGKWRLKNMVLVLSKAQKWVESNGWEVKAVPPDVFMPLIENASTTESVIISDMYASLLVCLLAPQHYGNIHPSFPKVLHNISALDAALLSSLYQGIRYGNFDYATKCYTLEAAQQLFKKQEFDILLSFQNLWRLGICDHKTGAAAIVENKQIGYTGFGWSFASACFILKSE